VIRTDTIVVKLGGSLIEAGTIRHWLRALMRDGAAAGRAVLVPGGGPFADAVRAAQQAHGFSDRAAHEMALLAMEQAAVMLADAEPLAKPCATLDAIRDALRQRRIPVWRPSRLALAAGEDELPASWAVTSDSLAAWLARRLGAAALVLVKSAAVPPEPDIADLAASGIVDDAFPRFAAGLDVAVLGPGGEERLAGRLRLPCPTASSS
jgi:dihydroneopterin aldolase